MKKKGVKLRRLNKTFDRSILRQAQDGRSGGATSQRLTVKSRPVTLSPEPDKESMGEASFQAGPYLKKKYGQHFLCDEHFIDVMLENVSLTAETNVFEIGGGAGVLTRAILRQPVKQLWTFEIDPEWAEQLQKINDPRLTVYNQDFLTVDFETFRSQAPWVLLANLPYQISFPVLYRLHAHRELLHEGVIMLQEEVAQKIVKTTGRGYGFNSLFFQYYFDWKLLDKVPPQAFNPPPHVFSRLLYFKPKRNVIAITDETKFWKFVKVCFAQPRRTLRNNLLPTEYNYVRLDEHVLGLRAQQLAIADFLKMWELLK